MQHSQVLRDCFSLTAAAVSGARWRMYSTAPVMHHVHLRKQSCAAVRLIGCALFLPFFLATSGSVACMAYEGAS